MSTPTLAKAQNDEFGQQGTQCELFLIPTKKSHLLPLAKGVPFLPREEFEPASK